MSRKQNLTTLLSGLVGAGALAAASTAAYAQGTTNSTSGPTSTSDPVTTTTEPSTSTTVPTQTGPAVVNPSDPAKYYSDRNTPANEPLLPTGLSTDAFFQYKAQLQSYFGDRFGGFWLDTSSAATKAVFGVVGPTAADQEELQTVLGGLAQDVTIKSVPYSMNDLNAYAAAVQALPGFSDHNNVQVSPKSNGLLIQTSLSPTIAATSAAFQQLSNSIQSVVPGNIVEIDVYANVSVQNNAGYRQYPPYKGGDGITDFFGDCTSGYEMIFDETYVGSTAGHCFANGTTLYGIGGGSPMIGNVFNNANGLLIDGELLTHDQTQHTASIYASATWVPVKGVISSSAIYVGMPECTSGIASQDRCGQVATLTPPPGDPYSTQRCNVNTTVDGDSGGPVYKRVVDSNGNETGVDAVGLTSGDILDNGIPILGCFQPIDTIEYLTGSVVSTTG
jgi:hypothetical protein